MDGTHCGSKIFTTIQVSSVMDPYCFSHLDVESEKESVLCIEQDCQEKGSEGNRTLHGWCESELSLSYCGFQPKHGWCRFLAISQDLLHSQWPHLHHCRALLSRERCT